MSQQPSMLGRALKQAGVLLLAALIPVLLTAAFHPRRPAWSRDQAMVTEVTLDTLGQWRGAVLLVDARGAAAYERQHIPGALSLSGGKWDDLLEALAKEWRPGMRVVVYCDNRNCGASQSVARRLRRELAVADIYVLKGGWDAWLEAQKSGP